MANEMPDRLERRAAAARWLQETRKRQYPVARKFAAKIGVAPYDLSNWETGRSAPGDDDARRIADGLGMDEIEVRRRLGLWVPDTPRREDDLDFREQIQRRVDAAIEELHRIRDGVTTESDTTARTVEETQQEPRKRRRA